MNRIAEVIYIVPEEREAFLERELSRNPYVERFLWKHGMRNQYYFKISDYIIMTFSYVGKNFAQDMIAIQKDPEVSSYFVQKKRKDVPDDQVLTTNWWAPLMKYGANLTFDPSTDATVNTTQYDQSVYKFYWDIDN